MDFDLNDQQMLMKDSVERLFQRHYSFAQRRDYAKATQGWSREMWRRYAEVGLLALPFDEEEGGLGGGPVETMIVMEAMGENLALEPYLGAIVLAGTFLARAASTEMRRNLVSSIATGDVIPALAHEERGARYDLAQVRTTATAVAGGWRLNGVKTNVLGGASADKLVVSARTSGDDDDREGISCFLVDAAAVGVVRRGFFLQDGHEAAEVTLRSVEVDDASLVGQLGKALPEIEASVECAIAAVAAEAVGAMAAMLRMTIDHLKTRKQFGQALANFQALQHRSADMFVQLELARSMAQYAVLALGEQGDERLCSISAVKAHIGQAARFIGQQGIQLHGGIGMTEEYAAGHFFRRLTVLALQFGDTDHHRARVAAAGGFVSPET